MLRVRAGRGARGSRPLTLPPSRYDTEPSILNCPIVSCTDRRSEGVPAAKRAKLAIDVHDKTILRLEQDGAYQSLDELSADVETAGAVILEACGVTDEEDNIAYAQRQADPRHTAADLDLLQKVMAFRKTLTNMIMREAVHRTHAAGAAQQSGSERSAQPVLADGHTSHRAHRAQPLTRCSPSSAMPKAPSSSSRACRNRLRFALQMQTCRAWMHRFQSRFRCSSHGCRT